MSSIAVAPLRRFDSRLAQMRGWRGAIESVHAHSAVARPHGAGLRLVLLHGERPLVPFGLGVLPVVRPGDAVSLDERRLDVGLHRYLLEGPGLSLSIAPGAGSLPKRFDSSLDALRRVSDTDGAVEKLLRRKLESEAARLAGWLVASSSDARDAVGALCGLGPGATPSGDDVLAGIAAFAHAHAGLLDAASRSAFLESIASARPGATTETGREMLLHASEGSFPEPLRNLVEALSAEDPRAVPAAASRLERLGASSGKDMMTGVAAMVSACARAPGASR